MPAAVATVAIAPVPARPVVVLPAGSVARTVASVPTVVRAPSLARSEVGVRLLRRLDAAMAHPAVEEMSALRAALTDLVDVLKAEGLPEARVVEAVETLVRDRGATPGRLRLHADAPPTPSHPTVHARLMTWCVRAYRDADWW